MENTPQVTKARKQRPREPRKPEGTRAECVRLRLEGLGIRAIARKLGVNHAAVSRHLQHEEAVAAVQEATAGMLDQCRIDVEAWVPELLEHSYRVAMGRVRASPAQAQALKLLLGLGGFVVEQRVTGAGGGPIQVHALRTLTDDEVDQQLAEARRKVDEERARSA